MTVSKDPSYRGQVLIERSELKQSHSSVYPMLSAKDMSSIYTYGTSGRSSITYGLWGSQDTLDLCEL